MAHYHLTVKNGKSGGGSAHSDYIEREGKYSNRDDLEYSESGNMPNFAKDNPSHFWNMADQHERLNGRPYKEIEFSLPRGLSQEQRISLAKEYVNNVIGDKQPFSFAIHNKIGSDGLENPHVHFMFSERSINEKTIGLSEEQFFKRNGATKNRAFTSRAFVWEARKEWTRTANHYLERNGFTTRIDERSYRDRNIDLTSTNRKMFDQSFEMRRSLRDIQKENGQKIIDDPTIALRALTSNNSTFTERDLETFIFRHTDGEAQYRDAYNSVIQSKEFVKILGKENFTTKELLDIEQDIVERTKESNKLGTPKLTESQEDKIALITSKRTFNSEQKTAFDNLASNAQIVSVNGSAGTGKSYVLGALNEYYQSDNKRVYGVALQGITAQAMQDDANIKSSTIAKFLMKHENGELVMNKDTVIVLDEAGMVGSRDFQKLLSITQESGAKIRMVGDSQQLNAVSAGNAYATIQEVLDKKHQSSLVHIMRQRSDEMKSASMDLSKHDIKSALEKYDRLGKLHESNTQESAQIKTAYDWSNSKTDSKIMLAYTNSDVEALNGYAREILRDRNEIGKEEYFAETYKGVVGFSLKDEIVFKESNKDLGVLNGSRGKVFQVNDDRNGNAISLGVELKDGRKVHVNLDKYDKLVHGYATTIHGSQGMTVEESHVLLSKNMNANLAYVALTRHKNDIHINYSKEQFDTNIKVNGREISARENIANEIGKAEIKTFTGREIEEESFKHFKDNYSIENRKTLAEKYNLRSPNNESKDDVSPIEEPTFKKSFFGSIKNKLSNFIRKDEAKKETPQKEEDKKAIERANSKADELIKAELLKSSLNESEKKNEISSEKPGELSEQQNDSKLLTDEFKNSPDTYLKDKEIIKMSENLIADKIKKEESQREARLAKEKAEQDKRVEYWSQISARQEERAKSMEDKEAKIKATKQAVDNHEKIYGLKEKSELTRLENQPKPSFESLDRISQLKAMEHQQKLADTEKWNREVGYPMEKRVAERQEEIRKSFEKQSKGNELKADSKHRGSDDLTAQERSEKVASHMKSLEPKNKEVSAEEKQVQQSKADEYFKSREPQRKELSAEEKQAQQEKVNEYLESRGIESNDKSSERENEQSRTANDEQEQSRTANDTQEQDRQREMDMDDDFDRDR